VRGGASTAVVSSFGGSSATWPSSTSSGFGQMVEVGGAWAFEMQMSTDRLGTRVLHWANMVQTREGDPSWRQLPGLSYSVPEMLDGAVYPRLDAG
jgi:hypothetical protein